MTTNNYNKYDEAFEKSLLSFRQNSTAVVDDGQVLTAKQAKELQKPNAQLEEVNLILIKALAIFKPHSSNDYTPSINYGFSVTSKPSAGS